MKTSISSHRAVMTHPKISGSTGARFHHPGPRSFHPRHPPESIVAPPRIPHRLRQTILARNHWRGVAIVRNWSTWSASSRTKTCGRSSTSWARRWSSRKRAGKRLEMLIDELEGHKRAAFPFVLYDNVLFYQMLLERDFVVLRSSQIFFKVN